MSGLEAIGVAASIIQVADLGTKLSVQLFSFYRRYKNANESIQLLSNEIALVSAILRELGDNLKKDESSKLCSQEAFRTLRLVLTQCRDVLGQIQKVIDGNDQSGKSRFQHVTGKFRIVLLEPSLDQLRVNLERLKSTMLLLLNVIMYAAQIRGYNVPTLVQEQRDLIQCLLDDRLGGSSKPRQSGEAAESARDLSTNTTRPGDRLAHPKTDGASRQEQNQSSRNPTETMYCSRAESQAQRATERNEPLELREYNTLIQRMLNELESCRSKLEKTRHSRIKDGVFNIHSGEIMRFKTEYGPSIHIDHSLFSEQKFENFHEATVTDPARTATSSRPSSRSAGTFADYIEEATVTDGSALVACQNCRTAVTTLWRRDEQGHTICNACGLYSELHGRYRPMTMNKSIISRRKRVVLASRDQSPTAATHSSNSSSTSPEASPALAVTNERVPRALNTSPNIELRRIRVYENDSDGDAQRPLRRVRASGAASSDTSPHDPDVELAVRQRERTIVERALTRYYVTGRTNLQDTSLSLTLNCLDDNPGTDGNSSGVESEFENGQKASAFERRGADAQEQTRSDLSLPDNLEDLLAQWTTLDKQEIQRGQIEAF